jgi:DNA repair photolyase
VAARRYTQAPATRALTPTGGFLRGFAYSLNPYTGCAFGAAGGCPFCYVRALPVARRVPGAWGDWVIAKSNLGALIERELAALKARGRLAETTVFMSSATDPYQGAERRYGLTRAALRAFGRYRVRRIVVQTRSPLIERDLDLLRELGDSVIASITIETDDDAVRRAITPTSPAVGRRLETCARLRAAGVFVQIAVSPMLPNDAGRFAALADSAADRVIVDTYFAGDGSGGRRSRALGIGELYAKLGWERWFRPGAENHLIEAMRARMGAARVLFSRDGFCAV